MYPSVVTRLQLGCIPRMTFSSPVRPSLRLCRPLLGRLAQLPGIQSNMAMENPSYIFTYMNIYIYIISIYIGRERILPKLIGIFHCRVWLPDGNMCLFLLQLWLYSLYSVYADTYAYIWGHMQVYSLETSACICVLLTAHGSNINIHICTQYVKLIGVPVQSCPYMCKHVRIVCAYMLPMKYKNA